MATVRAIITDALSDIGATAQNETPDAATAQRCLRAFQNQIDSWAAEELTLSIQSRTAITWPASTTSQTIGPSGGNITAQRPVWINQINYVVPGSSPAVEVVLAPMDIDSYAAQSIKALTSALPLSYFYQTSIDTILGTLILWPVPNQELTLYLYAPQAVTVPVTLDDVLLGPPGYQEAFLYNLEERLLHPFSVANPAIVSRVLQLSASAMDRMKRPNTVPSLMGVDAALVPSSGGAYNVLTDTQSGFSR